MKAEQDLIAYLGYLPLPDWVEGEIRRTARESDVSYRGDGYLMNTAGRFRSVKASLGHIITGGIRASDCTLIGEIFRPGDWQFLDLDGDGYFETAEIVVAYTRTDINEIRLYFEGHGGDPDWEIRPLRSVVADGTWLTIRFDRHLVLNPNYAEALNPVAIDADVDANFVTTLVLCRVYNDPSQQAQLQWERLPSGCSCGSATCAMCAWSTQWACLQTRDPRRGLVTYQPGTWDSTNEQFDWVDIALARQPERVRLWYLAGYRSGRTHRSYHDMDPLLEEIITKYSLCLLDRPVCECSNVEAFFERWTEDRALRGEAAYNMSERDLNCPFGTRTGALFAWRTITGWQDDKASIMRAARY